MKLSGDKFMGVEAAERERERESEGGGGKVVKGVMRLENLLPKMLLRVLLVEADDSTRHLIASLLRKCNYRVAAVPDGLKAWEMLKGRPRNIDLILTEVDLPSISGYALLTLIMEHEICKNIPVIMMSSQDSTSTVFKCIFGGAADYLVKPIRRNELRNLWQHVWRRQSPTIGVNGPQDESVAQQKVDATAENNAASNNSSGNAACIQRNKDLIENGCDAQSSYTKLSLEAESGATDNVQEFSLVKCGESYPGEIRMQEVETRIHLGQTSTLHDSHAQGLNVGICQNGETSTTNGKGDPEHHRSASMSSEVHDNHYVQINSSKEVIGLNGTFHTHPDCSLKSSIVNSTGKFDFSPQLDLCMGRSHPPNFENELSSRRHTIMHSNASAFKRYANKKLPAPPAVFINFCDQQREKKTNCEKSISDITTDCNSDGSTPSSQRSIMSPATAQSKESELANSRSHQGHSHPIPVKGVRFNDLSTAYGSVLPPVFVSQSGPPSMPSPSSFVLLDPTFSANAFYQSNIKENCSNQLYEPCGQNGNNFANHIVYTQEHKSECVEDQGHIYPATDQSACNCFCNGNANHLNSTGYGSNCRCSSNVDQVAMAREASEVKDEDIMNNRSSLRSIQREAALNKFRMKRKERCYEKKVRYEKRKKLAEQRPRVKGQFVSQVHHDPHAPEKDGKEYDH